MISKKKKKNLLSDKLMYWNWLEQCLNLISAQEIEMLMIMTDLLIIFVFL